MITITKSAEKQFNKLVQENSKYVRLLVNAGGCNGFSYTFDFDETATDEDEFLIPDVLLIDSMSKEVLQDFEINYIDDLTGSYFRLNIAKATSQCGCGTSFSI